MQVDLDALSEKELRRILREKKAARLKAEAESKLAAERARRAAEENVPPLPEYIKGADETDLLNFEYGLELAFRPKRAHCNEWDEERGVSPCKTTAEELVPYLYVSQSDGDPGPRWDRASPIKRMFSSSLRKMTVHIGAKLGGIEMTVCTEREMEFPSPIVDRMSQIDWYYERIRSLMNFMGATVDNTKVNSGGGHIHVTPKGEDVEFKDNEVYSVFYALSKCPWIAWVFNDPDDRSTACSVIKCMVSAIWDYYGDSDYNQENGQSWFSQISTDSDDCIRQNSGVKQTLEFRFFGAPHTKEEQLLHVRFLDSWLKSVLSHPRKLHKHRPPRLKYNTPVDLQAITFKQSVDGFNSLLVNLGLKPEDYQVFIDRNLKVRYENDWPRN